MSRKNEYITLERHQNLAAALAIVCTVFGLAIGVMLCIYAGPSCVEVLP